MSLLWALFIAISPAIAFLCYFYEADKSQGKSHEAKVKIFLLGLTSIIPISIFEQIVEHLFYKYDVKFYQYLQYTLSVPDFSSIPLSEAFSRGFLWSAAIEEFIKLIYVFLFVKKLKELNTKREAILYTVILGLAFACAENIFYVYLFQQKSISLIYVAQVRAFMSLPTHGICAVAMGWFVGRAKFSNTDNKSILYLGAWACATLIHGTYNTSLFINIPWTKLLALLLVIVGVYLSIRLIINLRKEEEKTANKAIKQEKESSTTNKKISIQDYAKQGNPQALEKLINHSLQPQGITAKIALKKNCLQVTLESEQIPDSKLVRLIRKKLINLGVELKGGVKVSGKQLGKEVPDWSEEFELTTFKYATKFEGSVSPSDKLLGKSIPQQPSEL
jgi:RsiW-degrading membrane proteinase PrsW (M82 family)